MFLHTVRKSNNKESIDTNTYRIAEQKSITNSREIETILKNKAVDCYLNEEINYISNMNKFNYISSRSSKHNRLMLMIKNIQRYIHLQINVILNVL